MTNTTGAQPVPAGTAETHGVSDITRVLSGYFDSFEKSDAVRKLARTDAEIATNNTIGERERILKALADIAHRHSWSEDDTGEAVKKAIEQHAGNDKSKKSSLSTFASEIKLACGKRVRARVADMFDLAREAWDDERATAANDSDAPQPLKKAFSRMYHVVVQGMMRAAKNGDAVPTDAETLCAFAQATIDARRVDTKRVKARLDAIRKELQSFTADFGAADGLAECIEFLGEISESELKAAYERKLRAPEQDEPKADAPEQHDEPEAPAPQTIDEMLEDALPSMAA